MLNLIVSFTLAFKGVLIHLEYLVFMLSMVFTSLKAQENQSRPYELDVWLVHLCISGYADSIKYGIELTTLGA